MKRVLLTGAAGFIGSRVARALVREGHAVHALVRPGGSEGAEATGGPMLVRLKDVLPEITLWKGDFTDPRVVDAVAAKARPDLCIHLAWYAAPGKYLNAAENLSHVGATLHLARVLRDAGCARFVGVGTCFEYDTSLGYLSETSVTAPASLYAASKLAVFNVLEKFTKSSPMTFAWARLFYQYGPQEPEGRLVSHLLRTLAVGKAADVTAGEQVRDFLHVDDVATAICTVAASDVQGAVNVGSGVPVTVRDVVTTLVRLWEANGKTSGQIRLGALPYRENDPMFICANNTKLKSLGWCPRFGLQEGLSDTLQAWQS